MNKISLIVFALMCIVSCKKTEDTAPATETYDDYAGLKVGNYRIYNTYFIDAQGKETLVPTYIDSVCITAEKTINGNKYFVESSYSNKKLQTTRYYRDSLHYLVNEYGNIYYSSKDFQNIILSDYQVYTDTICKRDFFMVDKDKQVTVPAGTFTTITFRNKMYLYPKENGSYPIRNADMIYAKGLGLISEMIYYVNDKDNHEERRLVRYGVN